MLEEPDYELDDGELDDEALLDTPPGTWSDEERERLCSCESDFERDEQCPVHGDEVSDGDDDGPRSV